MEKRDCVAILFSKNKEFLLQKKTQDYKKAPGKWGFFGGGIEKAETPEQAIKRETREELGIELKEFRLVKSKEYKTSYGFGKFFIFGADFNIKISDIKLGEGAGFAFFTKEEIEKLDIMEGDDKSLIEVINEY